MPSASGFSQELPAEASTEHSTTLRRRTVRDAAQQVQATTCDATHIRALAADPAVLFPIQLLAEEDGPSVWAPSTNVGDLNEAPGSWLQPGLLLAIVTGSKPVMKDLYLSFSLCNSNFQKKLIHL